MIGQKRKVFGLGYMIFSQEDGGLIGKGPIAKNIDIICKKLISDLGINEDDGVFLYDEANRATKFSGKVRTKLAEELNLIKDDNGCFVG